MGWLVTHLGYGMYGLLDADNPNSPPQVDVNGTIQANPQLAQNFGRILNQQFNDTEEIRMLRPTTYVNAFEYCGVAIAGSLTSSAVWTCIRKTYDSNSRASRLQIRTNVVWDNVTQNWP